MLVHQALVVPAHQRQLELRGLVARPVLGDASIDSSGSSRARRARRPRSSRAPWLPRAPPRPPRRRAADRRVEVVHVRLRHVAARAGSRTRASRAPGCSGGSGSRSRRTGGEVRGARRRSGRTCGPRRGSPGRPSPSPSSGRGHEVVPGPCPTAPRRSRGRRRRAGTSRALGRRAGSPGRPRTARRARVRPTNSLTSRSKKRLVSDCFSPGISRCSRTCSVAAKPRVCGKRTWWPISWASTAVRLFAAPMSCEQWRS